jgi:hypothetical protein
LLQADFALTFRLVTAEHSEKSPGRRGTRRWQLLKNLQR